MLDGFDSTNPEDYIKGFPWHPHRGIETVTYLINGAIEHGDSLGNRGTLRGGDVGRLRRGQFALVLVQAGCPDLVQGAGQVVAQ